MVMKVKEAVATYKVHKKKYTYQDYLDLPADGKRYEIINGELIMAAAPYTTHMRVSKRIYNELLAYSQNETIGEIFYAPIDVYLSETNIVQPDLLFILKENSHIITERYINGAPDLVIEILSTSTAYHDLIEKKELYAQYGVHEYWFVDPKRQCVEIYLNKDREFELQQRVEKDEAVASIILPGFQVELEEIFEMESTPARR